MANFSRKCFFLFLVFAAGILHAQTPGRDSIVTYQEDKFGFQPYDNPKKASDIPKKPTLTSNTEIHFRNGKMVGYLAVSRESERWDSAVSTIRYDASGKELHSSTRTFSSHSGQVFLTEKYFSDSLIITQKQETYYAGTEQEQHSIVTDTIFLSSNHLPDSSLHYQDGKLRGRRIFMYKFHNDGRLLEKKQISSGIFGAAGEGHTVIYRYAYHEKDTLQTYISSYLGSDSLNQYSTTSAFDVNGNEIKSVQSKGDSITATLIYIRDANGRILRYESGKATTPYGYYLYKDDGGKHESLYVISAEYSMYSRTDTLVSSKGRRVNSYDISSPLPAGTTSIPDKVKVQLHYSTWLNKEGLVTKVIEYKFGRPVSIKRFIYSN